MSNENEEPVTPEETVEASEPTPETEAPVDQPEAVSGEVIDSVEEKKSEPLALAGMIVGIVSAVFSTLLICCYGYIPGFICGIVAVILSFIAMNKIKEDPTLDGKNFALTGLITGAVGILVGILLFVIIIVFGVILVAAEAAQSGY